MGFRFGALHLTAQRNAQEPELVGSWWWSLSCSPHMSVRVNSSLAVERDNEGRSKLEGEKPWYGDRLRAGYRSALAQVRSVNIELDLGYEP